MSDESKWPEVWMSRKQGISFLTACHERSNAEAIGDEVTRYVPISSIRERLLSDGVESLAKLNYAKHVHAMDYPEDLEGETEGHRNLWLDGAREQLRDALAAAFPEDGTHA